MDTPTPEPTPTVLPAGATWTSPIDGMMQVYVPAGEFLMGSAESDSDARDDEKPQHTVYLDAFWMDKTEVTTAQYRRCVEAGACSAPLPLGDESCTYDDGSKSDHPMNCLLWWDAADYCAWAGRRVPRRRSGKRQTAAQTGVSIHGGTRLRMRRCSTATYGTGR